MASKRWKHSLEEKSSCASIGPPYLIPKTAPNQKICALKHIHNGPLTLTIFHAIIALRHVFYVGGVVGFATGLFWSVTIALISIDQLFDGTELILSLAVPGLIGIIIWQSLKISVVVVIPIAYLTIPLPLLGLGQGGASTIHMAIGGLIGGFFWSIPFILYYLVRSRFTRDQIHSLRSAGRISKKIDQ